MKSLLVVGVLVGVVGLFIFMNAKADPATLMGSWKVNWEKTASTIHAVPSTHADRYASVEEFRKKVSGLARGLVLEIQPSQKALLHWPSGSKTKLEWRPGEEHDLWLQQRIFMSASIGHGFTKTGGNTGILLFQLDYSESVATRVELIVERQ